MSAALAANSSVVCRQAYHREKQAWSNGGSCVVLSQRTSGCLMPTNNRGQRQSQSGRRSVRIEALWPDLSRPTSVQMEPINDSDHLDQILRSARQLSQPIVIDWMASWCRKCIYLKPKLEKLAAEFDTKMKFYYVDVNKVPQALVKRGNISKMPTIQVWKDGEKKEEVIGGHKAWLVIEEVKEMIKKFV